MPRSAGLDAMTPRRLWLLARPGESLGALWQAIVSGEPGGHVALGHLIREAPELAATWSRSAARVDVAALWDRCTRCPGDAVSVVGRPGYPADLAEDPLPPGVLFTRGSLEALTPPSVAIVGTRHATVGGMEVAASLGRELAAAGIAVVSGLAKGIDGAAHRGALSADGRSGAHRGRGQRARHRLPALQRGPLGGGRAGGACSARRCRRGPRRRPTGSRPATASSPRWPTRWSSSSPGRVVVRC